jgi:hypothetical protein
MISSLGSASPPFISRSWSSSTFRIKTPWRYTAIPRLVNVSSKVRLSLNSDPKHDLAFPPPSRLAGTCRWPIDRLADQPACLVARTHI